MAIEIDQHCGFHREEEHYHARHAFFGLQFIRATTYAFRASYRGRVLSWRQGVPASDLEAMRRRQAQIPVLMMAAGKRAWWWFQDQFHSLTEPYDDPLVIKGLILEWRQRRARKAARAAATASGRTAPRPPKKPRRRGPETASSSPRRRVRLRAPPRPCPGRCWRWSAPPPPR